MSNNHNNHNNQKKPEVKEVKIGGEKLAVPVLEESAKDLEKKIIHHAYLLEELKTRDIGKLLWYVRKHRLAKQNESS